MHISYNAPVTLTYALISFFFLCVNISTRGAFNNVIASPGDFEVFSIISWTSSITYMFGHAGYGHYMGNMIFILLLGPLLERQYGSKNLIFMMVITAVATSIANAFFFPYGLIGASGIVFMMVMLTSLISVKSGEIPLTFLLILLLYVGAEVASFFGPADGISHFAHIAGGIAGACFGFALARKKDSASAHK